MVGQGVERFARRCVRWLAVCWVVALSISGPAALAADLQAVPPLEGRRVIDQTATLTAAQTTALTQKLAALEQQNGSQLVVLMLPTTAPEDIVSYAQRVGDEWKLGRRDVGDGLIVIVAKDDRRVRIAVAKALEGAIPDLEASRVIEERITPAFRSGDYAGGLNAGVDRLSALVKREALPAPAERSGASRSAGPQWSELAMFFFAGVPIVGSILSAVLGRKLGSLATGAAAGGIGWLLTASALLAGAAAVIALVLVGVVGVGGARRGRGGIGPIVWGGGGGGFGGGGGGGGFRSGGGGDFGGSGASGRW